MPNEIENYAPQIVLKNQKKQAFAVWSFFGFLVAGWIFLILLAPLAEENSLTGISDPIYKFFSYICHQMPSRSFYIENHSFAVCARCFGIYAGLFFGFFAYPFFRLIEETEPLPRFWLFLALIPMGADWSLGFFGIWENTHFSRFLTGLILGITCAFFIIPALIELAQLFSYKKASKKAVD
ncbi:MAG: DUF2085 domain-containing protein [Acidobacteriota bacterium]